MRPFNSEYVEHEICERVVSVKIVAVPAIGHCRYNVFGEYPFFKKNSSQEWR